MVNPIANSKNIPPSKENFQKGDQLKAENKNIMSEQNLDAADYESRKAIFGSFEDSIKIFVEMIKHQDPMNPQDPGEMASKFAEFGQVIGLMDVKDELKKSTEMHKNTQMLQAAAQIDKTVEFKGDRFYLSGDKSSEINFVAPEQSKYCNIIISSPDRKIVTSKTIEVEGGQKNSFIWDGKNYQQNSSENGTYLVKVVPLDEHKKILMNPKTKKDEIVITSIKDQVSGGIRQNGIAKVMIGGKEGTSYSLEDLLAIHSQQEKPYRLASTTQESSESSSSDSENQIPETEEPTIPTETQS